MRKPRSYGRNVRGFTNIFNSAFFDPARGQRGPSRNQMAKRFALMSNLENLGYGNNLNRILQNATPAQMDAAVSAARSTTAANSPIKWLRSDKAMKARDNESPWRKDFTPKQRAAQLAGKKVSDKKIQK